LGTEQSATQPSGALAGLRVVDFGQYLAGPLAGMLLADQGAEVIHVDPPGGPRWDTPANATWNRGKQAILLDLKDPGDLALARRLTGAADVVLENFRPHVMDRLGLGPEAVLAANPGVIYCSMPGFAADDPRAGLPGWEGVVSAAAAAYSPLARPGETPGPGGPAAPVFSAVPIASGFAAFLAAAGVAAALRARRHGHRGQRLESPLFDAMFVALGYRASKLPPLEGAAIGGPSLRLLGLYQCADQRWIYFHTGSKRAQPFLAAAGAGDWLDAPDARDRAAALFATRPARAWEDLGAEVGAEVAMARTTAEWIREPHALAGGLVIEVDDPRYGRLRQPGLAATMSATPGGVRFPARPADADRAAILAGLQAVERRAPKPPAAPMPPVAAPGPAPTAPEPAAALAGVRVVDLAIVLAGPTCGRTLAEFGADVVKVEMPPERARRGLGLAPGASAVLRAFNVDVNRGKRSIVLDLKTEAGRELLWELIDQADVLVENFRGGVIDALGFGYDAVRARRPGIVYASLNTYGYAGPWRNRPGHEQLAQTVSGMAERYGGDGPPVLQNVGALDDYGTGVLGAYAVIAALLHRDRTGDGQRVTTALASTAGTLQSPFLHEFSGPNGDVPRGQDARGYQARQQLYAGSDGTWFFVGAGTAGLTGVQGLGDLPAEPSSAELAGRFARAPADVWIARLTAAGAGAHRVVPLEELMADPWVRAHGLITERFHEGIGQVQHPGPAVRMSVTPVRVGRPAPAPGADRAAVLAQLGGHDGPRPHQRRPELRDP
jgi:crotonobetainyl-CoA:carnitine CoA-transferase CaiB-like acyl-CoA transferase